MLFWKQRIKYPNTRCLPWLDDVEDHEAHGKEETDATDGDVRDADEVVLAADPGCGGEDQRLGATEAVRVVVVLYDHRDLVARHDIRFDPAVELPERREGRGPHPHD